METIKNDLNNLAYVMFKILEKRKGLMEEEKMLPKKKRQAKPALFLYKQSVAHRMDDCDND